MSVETERLVTDDKWVRSSDGYIGGVCAGLSNAMGVSVVFLRFVFIFLALLGGTGLLIYPMMWVSLPLAEDLPMAREAKILGVCGRIHSRIGMDIGLVRFIALFLALSSLGVTVLIYILLHFILGD